MKKFCKFLSFIILIQLSISCESFLSQESPSVITENSLFSNVDFAEKAIFACYEGLCDQYTYGRFLNNLDADCDIEFSTGASTSGTYALSHYDVNDGSQYLDGLWTGLYKVIERTNICIDNLPKSILWSDKETSADAKNMYGEAVTIRAFAYHLLIRNWGDVPFFTTSTQGDSNFFPPKTDRDSIYEYIIKDLKDIQDYVPWRGKSRTTLSAVRVSKGFVKGLRARLALHYAGYSLRNKTLETRRGRNWQEYYQIANQECKEIIESGEHKLNPSFENIWRLLCTYSQDESYRESLFELAFGKYSVGYMGTFYGAMYINSSNTKYGGASSQIKTSPAFFYSFDRSDLRRNVSSELYCYGSSATPELQTLNGSNGYSQWDLCKYRRSWILPLMGAEKTNGTGVNKCVMRYADIFLMLAESENEINGPTQIAKEALSTVRKRAFPEDVWPQKVNNYVDSVSVSKQDFFNAIVDERAWELSGENIRKADLIRWNILGPKTREMKEEVSKIVNNDPKYAQVPDYIFWKRSEANTEIIEILNPDYRLPSTAIPGYTRSNWLPRMSESQKNTLFNNIYPLILHGYDEAKNNHLYPIHMAIISSSKGSLVNDQIP